MGHLKPLRKCIAGMAVLFVCTMAWPWSARAQGPPKPLSKADIVRLLKGDVSPKRVAAMARERGIDFQVTSETEAELRRGGATDELVSTLRELAPKPPEATPAGIFILTLANAEVYLDDQFKGRASREGELVIGNATPGVHTLRVSLTGKKDYEQKLTVVAGQTTDVTAALAQSSGARAPQAAESQASQAKQPQRTACFIHGHGERDLESSDHLGYERIKIHLENENFQVKTLVLLQKMEIPPDCSLLVVAGPKNDYLGQEVETIRKYLQSGGRALFMVDPGIDLPNLSKLLSDWNVTVHNDLIIDLNASPLARLFRTEPTVAVILRYGSSPIVEPLARAITLFPMTRSFAIAREPKAGVGVESLCETSPDSFGFADFDAKAPPKQVSFRAGKDYKGPLTVAVSATLTREGKNKAEGRFVALGTSSLAANASLRFRSNRELIMNMVNWLSGVQGVKGPVVVAGPKPKTKIQVTPSKIKEPLPVPESDPDASQAQSALRSLRIINTSEVTYASVFTQGYSRTLAALGGPKENTTAEAAGLIDELLAGGRTDGYVFTYKPGRVDEAGRTDGYTLVARPIKWRQGLLSFFTDQSGVIRGTTEDREPIEEDQPIAG